MQPVTLAFYKARGTRLDRAIRWRTRSDYSHVEIVIGPHWYTSSPRDGGVRRKEIVPKAGHWDYVPVEIDVEHVIQLYARTAWDRYDWLGIAGHAIGIPRIHCAKRWTCSEWVAEAMGLSRAYRYTPADLWALAAIHRV